MSALLLALCLGAGATYAPGTRADYLDAALQALRSASPKVAEQGYGYLSAMERGACASDNERLRSDCLIASARRFCRSGGRSEGDRCRPMMDIIAANVLAERELIGTAERLAMMQREQNFRPELARRLRRIQGSLAAELRLSQGTAPGSFGARVDRFCIQTADRSSLSWQTCAAALVWFIGREP